MRKWGISNHAPGIECHITSTYMTTEGSRSWIPAVAGYIGRTRHSCRIRFTPVREKYKKRLHVHRHTFEIIKKEMNFSRR
jgi:hypothetical protein